MAGTGAARTGSVTPNSDAGIDRLATMRASTESLSGLAGGTDTMGVAVATSAGRVAGSGCTTAVAGVDATVVLTAAGLVGVAVGGVGATAAAVTTGCCGVAVAATGFAVAGAGVTTGRVIALAIATLAAEAVVGSPPAGARDGKGCTIAVVLACVTGAGLVAAGTG